MILLLEMISLCFFGGFVTLIYLPIGISSRPIKGHGNGKKSEVYPIEQLSINRFVITITAP